MFEIVRIGTGQPHHAHDFLLETDVNNDHSHLVEGYTRAVNGNSYDLHYHLLRGVTSFENDHFHRFYGKTGPAIPLSDGTHYHEIGILTLEGDEKPEQILFGGIKISDEPKQKHHHQIKGRTMKSVGYDLEHIYLMKRGN